MDNRLERIRELINAKEKIDAELEQLLGAIDVRRRGRPRKEAVYGPDARKTLAEPERQEEAAT